MTGVPKRRRRDSLGGFFCWGFSHRCAKKNRNLAVEDQGVLLVEDEYIEHFRTKKWGEFSRQSCLVLYILMFILLGSCAW